MLPGVPASLKAAVLAITESLLASAKRYTAWPGKRLRCAGVLPSLAPKTNLKKAFIASSRGVGKL